MDGSIFLCVPLLPTVVRVLPRLDPLKNQNGGASSAPPLTFDPSAVYCVFVFTASPVLNPDPDTTEQTEETSSTSVTFTMPIELLKRRRTCPVAGSLISLVTRSTLSSSPTFTPDFAPTFRITWPPSTAATRPWTTIVRATSLSLPATTSVAS